MGSLVQKFKSPDVLSPSHPGFTMVTYISIDLGDQACVATSLPAILVANLVCIKSCASTAGDCANDCALLATYQSAYYRATTCSRSSGDLVAVTLPN